MCARRMWDYLALTRIYTKKRGQPPDFVEPVVLTAGRYGVNVESLCNQIHRCAHWSSTW